MVQVSGFTIVRNAIKLDFPLEASIRSILPLCDEVVVNVGRSEDETLALVRSIGDPKIRIVETEWDMTRQNTVLGLETLRAMRACRHPWGVYIQADEVLHERGAESWPRPSSATTAIRGSRGCWCATSISTAASTPSPTHRRWYRREVRAVRLDPALDIRPYQGAQGFRVGPEHRKIRARLTTAEMFHYGWARPAQALREKRELGKTMYPWRDADERKPLLAWVPGIRPLPRDAIPRWRGPGSSRAGSIPTASSRRGGSAALPALLRLRGDRAADRRSGVRVPELHARLRAHAPARMTRPASSSSSRLA